MPMITVRFARPQAGPDITDRIGRAVNELSSEFLKKDPNITAVTVEEVDPARWFVANKSLKDQGLASFWFDVRVVEGTNTREEKAAFVAASFARMSALLGPLHRESYVHVNEVRGDAYGYGGLTQNERYFAARRDAARDAA
jgi:4-oxalocrotonate tautomerase